MLWPLIYPPANMGFLLACVLVSLDVIVHDAACSAKPHQGYSQEGAFNPKTAIGVSGKHVISTHSTCHGTQNQECPA